MTLPILRDYVGVSAWHQAGYTGQGVRIGIIDVGFAQADQLHEGLIVPDDTIFSTDFSNHGTMVLEILLALAPSAEYYLYRITSGVNDLGGAVDWMLAQDIHILNYSISSVDVPLNGDNYQTQQMARLIDQNVLVVTSMGNYGLSYITDTFRDVDGDGWHEFPGGVESVKATALYTELFGQVYLRWKDVYTSAEIDLDLYVLTEDTSEILFAATHNQRGGAADWPYEDAFFPTTAGGSVQLAIRAKIPSTLPGTVIFYLYANDIVLNNSLALGSVTAPADSEKIISVGAIERSELLWERSGRGPTWDGRIKPDLVTSARIWLPFANRSFVGTSASAPVVAGVAAVVKSAFPELSEAEIRRWLLDNALDLGADGTDNHFGYGRVWIPAPR